MSTDNFSNNMSDVDQSLGHIPPESATHIKLYCQLSRIHQQLLYREHSNIYLVQHYHNMVTW
jgi:hypothetical protein